MSDITMNIDNELIINKQLQGNVVKTTIETTDEIYKLTTSNDDKNYKKSKDEAMASIEDIFEVFK